MDAAQIVDLREALKRWVKAAYDEDGSNDAEHAAAHRLATVVAGVLGLEIDYDNAQVVTVNERRPV